MIKGIVITILVMIGLIDYALVVACGRLEDKERGARKAEYPPCYALLRGLVGS